MDYVDPVVRPQATFHFEGWIQPMLPLESINVLFVCLFVWSYRPTRGRVERSSLPMRAANFDL